jgi:Tol biopolymer transport system component
LKETQISGLPENPKIAFISWSPNEKKIAFTHTTTEHVELWVVDVVSAKATKVGNNVLNANLGNPITWFKDSENILVRCLPSQKDKLIDASKELPMGPTISNSDGSKAQNRTYQDLLKNKNDEHNFDVLASSELYKINLAGKSTLWERKKQICWRDFFPRWKICFGFYD